jgi:predicted nucleic acid-binding protein
VGRGRVVLDSGAVIALAAGKPRARARLEEALERRAAVVLPAVVLAETTRGGPRDALVNRLVKQVEEITPATEATARLAGNLLGSAGRNDTVDALVVAEAALWRNTVILTTDARDLSALAADLPGVRVLAV